MARDEAEARRRAGNKEELTDISVDLTGINIDLEEMDKLPGTLEKAFGDIAKGFR